LYQVWMARREAMRIRMKILKTAMVGAANPKIRL
jgi:hypothetical protein